jgi:hypothetical protein
VLVLSRSSTIADSDGCEIGFWVLASLGIPPRVRRGAGFAAMRRAWPLLSTDAAATRVLRRMIGQQRMLMVPKLSIGARQREGSSRSI